mmetsp:Transcript_27723/g.63628  ORF Transcript_27723/g.63628 Transcript_27723/m.63628 type:complete len:228 (-) Transcript_27723:237-920(-)
MQTSFLIKVPSRGKGHVRLRSSTNRAAASSSCSSGCSYEARMNLPASIGEPPPMQIIRSGLKARHAATPRRTVAMSGSGLTSSKTLTEKPCFSRLSCTRRTWPSWLITLSETMSARLHRLPVAASITPHSCSPSSRQLRLKKMRGGLWNHSMWSCRVAISLMLSRCSGVTLVERLLPACVPVASVKEGAMLKLKAEPIAPRLVGTLTRMRPAGMSAAYSSIRAGTRE